MLLAGRGDDFLVVEIVHHHGRFAVLGAHRVVVADV